LTGEILGRDPAGVQGALEGLAAHLDASGGGIDAQDRGHGAADKAEMHARIAGGGVRRDVLIALDEADLIAWLHVLGMGEWGRGQQHEYQQMPQGTHHGLPPGDEHLRRMWPAPETRAHSPPVRRTELRSMSSQVQALRRLCCESEDGCGWISWVYSSAVIIPLSTKTLANWFTSTIDRAGGVGLQWTSGGIV
jgi:hypothetical protein